MCELFPDPFAATNLIKLADEQDYLIRAKFEGAHLTAEQEAQVGVVILGECTGEPHLFHRECVQGHFDSQVAGDASRQFYKCMIC